MNEIAGKTDSISIDPTTAKMIFDVNEAGTSATITLTESPNKNGQITISYAGKNVEVVLEVGKSDYQIDLPTHGVAQNPYSAGSVQYAAVLTDGGYVNPIAPAAKSVILPYLDTMANISVAQTEADPGKALIVISLDQKPKSTAIVEYTINGETFTAAFGPGETRYVHEVMPIAASVYGDKTTFNAALISATGGGFAHLATGGPVSAEYANPAATSMTLNVVDDTHATVTLVDVPRESGTLVIEFAGKTVSVPVVAGQTSYPIDLIAHGVTANAYAAGHVDYTASITGGGYALAVAPANDTLDIPATETTATVEITQSENIAHIVITPTNPPAGEGKVTFTVNGVTHEGVITPEKPYLEFDATATKANPHIEVKVTGIIGGYGNAVAGAYGETDFILNAPVVSGVESISLSEANLADGTNPDDAALTKEGTFTVNMNGLSGKLNVGGKEIDLDKDGNGAAPTEAITMGNVSLTITKIANGVVSYEATLTDASSAESQTFNIGVSNAGGNATASMKIAIGDDAPSYKSATSVTDTKIWIYATDSDDDHFAKSMWIGEKSDTNLDLSLNPAARQSATSLKFTSSGSYGSNAVYRNYSISKNETGISPFVQEKEVTVYKMYAGVVYRKSSINPESTITIGDKTYVIPLPAYGSVGIGTYDLNPYNISWDTEFYSFKLTHMKMTQRNESGDCYNLYGELILKEAIFDTPEGQTSKIIQNFITTKDISGGRLYRTFYEDLEIADSIPEIKIRKDVADVSFGGDDGPKAKIEIAKDQAGTEKYVWQTPEGESTNLSNLTIGSKLVSTDGKLLVENTADGYKFTELGVKNDGSGNLTVNAADSASGSIFDIINKGADTGTVEWDALPEGFTVNPDGTWSANSSGVLTWTYTDADGDEITGSITVNIHETAIKMNMAIEGETATITLTEEPTTSGQIVITSSDGKNTFVNLIPGQATYEGIILKHGAASVYADQEVQYGAKVSGGFSLPVNEAHAAGAVEALQAASTIALSKEGSVVHVVVGIDHPAISDADVVFTINGVEKRGTIPAGSSAFTWDYALESDTPVHIDARVTSVTGGGFARPVSVSMADGNFSLLSPELAFETMEFAFSESSLPEGTHPNETAITKHGQFNVNMNGLSGVLNIGGIEIPLDVDGNGQIPASPITSGAVSMTINSIANGVVDYTLTLTGSEDHGGLDAIERNFAISVDTVAGSATSDINAVINDDAPVNRSGFFCPEQIWINVRDSEGDTLQKTM